eukprot:431716-Pyramimonas_sp.AAC.1
MARGSSLSRGRGAWGQRPDCGSCEYSDVLSKVVRICRGCTSRVPLCKPYSPSARRKVGFDLTGDDEEQL